MLARIVLASLLLGTSGPLLLAQETSEGLVAATPEQKEFDVVFAEMKELISSLRVLQERFQTAAEGERPALQEEFAALIRQAKEVEPRLVAAAEKAYVAAPNQNKDVTAFMSTVTADHIRSDRYEEAFRLAQMLIDHDVVEKYVYLYAGFAALVLDDYDRAEKYLKVADEAKLITSPSPPDTSPMASMIRQVIQFRADPEKYRKVWAAEQAIRAAEAEADDLPRVRLETSQGEMLVELFENEAPNTVANFVNLVEKGYYDGLTFHRVLSVFMAQGGDPKGDGTGGPGYYIPCECHQENARNHFRGTLSMAHAGRDTGGSQFFLTFVSTSFLNGRHTAFGRVIEGMDVLAKLTRIDPQKPNPGLEPDRIVKATVERKRDHAYEPKTLPEVQ